MLPVSAGHQGGLVPLSLYVHVPWCLRKCPYCDFNSHAVQGDLPQREYLKALLADMDLEMAGVQGRRLSSIFIGGGTPSLMDPPFFAELLSGLQARIGFDADIEITLEANPGTFERERFRGFRDAGITRLSIGVQSFADPQLQALGRIHSGAEAYQAIDEALALDFKAINIDLMHGLPGQTPALALADLERALSLGTQHLSWYQLTIEPNTEFHARPPTLPMDEQLWAIQEQGLARLTEAGFEHYEISAYCRPGYAARHNLNYWQFGDYLGIGAGAHGKITSASGVIERRWKARQPKAYLEGPGVVGSQVILPEELPLEFMLNALRLTAGVPTELYAQRTGDSLQSLAGPLQRARELGLMADDPHRLVPTEQGRLFLNELLALF